MQRGQFFTFVLFVVNDVAIITQLQVMFYNTEYGSYENAAQKQDGLAAISVLLKARMLFPLLFRCLRVYDVQICTSLRLLICLFYLVNVISL